jgi:hypothetical protein
LPFVEKVYADSGLAVRLALRAVPREHKSVSLGAGRPKKRIAASRIGLSQVVPQLMVWLAAWAGQKR